MTANGFSKSDVLAHVERVLASTPFRQADRSTALLRYLAERSLNDPDSRVKEYTVGVEALGKGSDFDPRTDPIVRAEASRLRGRLERYYAGEGKDDAIRIEVPKGAYTLRFSERPVDSVDAESPPERSLSRSALWAAVGLVVVAAFAAGSWAARQVPREVFVTWNDVQLQNDERLASEVGNAAVISPDGSRVVYVSIDSSGVTHLRIRRFDSPSPPIDLPGTAGARGPFWSPDSRWIGYWAAGQLRKIAVDGGAPVVLTDVTDLLGASWGADGYIVAAVDGTLSRINASSGGTPEPIADLVRDGAGPVWPQLLPGGTHVIYTLAKPESVDRASIEVVSLQTGERRTLVEGGTFGRYVAPGYLTYVNQGTLFAVPFDPRRLEVRGAAVPIVDDIVYSPVFGYAQVSFSDEGTMVYQRAPARGESVVSLVDSVGRLTPIIPARAHYNWPALSPDGRYLAVSVIDGGVATLSLFDVRDGGRRLWSAPGVDAPVWTRDSRHMVGRWANGIARLDAATGTSRDLVTIPNVSVPGGFGPGDRVLAFGMVSQETAFDIWTVHVGRTNDSLHAAPPEPLLRFPSYETHPSISPDGRWLAYASNESGINELYVRSLADTSVKVRVATGGRVARWSRSMPRLFYSTAEQRIMAVDYAIVNGAFVPGEPWLWTSIELSDTGVLPNYNIAPDGKSIVAIVPPVPKPPNQVTIVNDVRELLRR